jgi:hypothetical protein
LYGKYFIQFVSVEKYSSRLKPYQRGFFAVAGEGDDWDSVAEAPDRENAKPEGKSVADATAAADVSKARRVKRGELDADAFVSA